MNIAKMSPFPNGKSVSAGAKNFLKKMSIARNFEPCALPISTPDKFMKTGGLIAQTPTPESPKILDKLIKFLDNTDNLKGKLYK